MCCSQGILSAQGRLDPGPDQAPNFQNSGDDEDITDTAKTPARKQLRDASIPGQFDQITHHSGMF
jgi:hypothetical protein